MVAKKKPITNKTKDALFNENKVLRNEVKNLAQKLKDALSISEVELGDDHQVAVGLYKKDGDYYMVKIGYNPENGACKVLSNEKADRNSKSAALSQHNTEIYLSDEIFDKLEK